MTPTVVGVDFTSSPTVRKPITVAIGTLRQDQRGHVQVQLDMLATHTSFESFANWLQTPAQWVAAFDFPFGLPRELVEQLQWPGCKADESVHGTAHVWQRMITHYASLTREHIRTTFKAFCDARPVGQKFAHRACDKPAGSSPSMKWVNPPVAYMLHAGTPLLMQAGVTVPGMQPGDGQRIALEGYPGYLARAVIGNTSYKSDDKARQTTERLIARRNLIEHLMRGVQACPVRLKITASLQSAVVQDGSADLLDAVLCMLQAGHASLLPRYGLPELIDPVEGWIATVPVVKV